MKTFHCYEKTFNQNYYAKMGNTAVVNNRGVRLQPKNDRGQKIHNHYLNFVNDVIQTVVQNPLYEHLFTSHKFLATDPNTKQPYTRGKDKGFWRHKDANVRSETSKQYQHFLNNANYQCGKCWTIEEIVVYYLQAFENSKLGKLEEFYKEHIMRTNRLIEHLITYSPNDMGHLIDYYINIKTY